MACFIPGVELIHSRSHAARECLRLRHSGRSRRDRRIWDSVDRGAGSALK